MIGKWIERGFSQQSYGLNQPLNEMMESTKRETLIQKTGKMRNCSDVTQFQQQNIWVDLRENTDATKNYISITINCDNLEKETR